MSSDVSKRSLEVSPLLDMSSSTSEKPDSDCKIDQGELESENHSLDDFRAPSPPSDVMQLLRKEAEEGTISSKWLGRVGMTDGWRSENGEDLAQQLLGLASALACIHGLDDPIDTGGVKVRFWDDGSIEGFFIDNSITEGVSEYVRPCRSILPILESQQASRAGNKI